MRPLPLEGTVVSNKHPEKVLKWLQSKSSLNELSGAYPELRATIRAEVADIVTNGTAADLPAYLERMSLAEHLLENNITGVGEIGKSPLLWCSRVCERAWRIWQSSSIWLLKLPALKRGTSALIC